MFSRLVGLFSSGIDRELDNGGRRTVESDTVKLLSHSCWFTSGPSRKFILSESRCSMVRKTSLSCVKVNDDDDDDDGLAPKHCAKTPDFSSVCLTKD